MNKMNVALLSSNEIIKNIKYLQSLKVLRSLHQIQQKSFPCLIYCAFISIKIGQNYSTTNTTKSREKNSKDISSK